MRRPNQQTPRVDERWAIAGTSDSDLPICLEGPRLAPGRIVVVVPRSFMASYRAAFAEIAEALNHSDTVALDVIAGIVANGPLATAPGGAREDECFRLREELWIAQLDASLARSELDSAVASETQILREQVASLQKKFERLRTKLAADVARAEARVEAASASWDAEIARLQARVRDEARAALKGPIPVALEAARAEGARQERDRKTELLRGLRAEVAGMTPPPGGQRTQQHVLRALDSAIRIVLSEEAR